MRAILVVHLYGLPADMAAFRRLADRYGVLLIEDCAQAHGAAIGGRKVATFGDAAIFSFYPTKNLTTGEGGMVLTPHADVARRARLLVDPRGDEEYAYEVVGFNFRMTEMCGAIGLVQLGALEGAQRAPTGERPPAYEAVSQTCAGCRRRSSPPGIVTSTINTPCACGRGRDELSKHLTANGIGNRVYYPTLVPHTAAYQKRGFGGRFPAGEQLTTEVLSLPVHPALGPDEIDTVIDVVRAFPGV